MYAVREEVEVLKEQIKELYERNSMLERENAVLKSLANTDQLGQVSSQLNQGSSTPPQQHPLVTNDNNNTPLAHHEGSQSIPHQPNITSAWSLFLPYTCSNTHFPRIGVGDPVRKDKNCYRPRSFIKQKAGLCVQYAPFEEINNYDIFVCHQEPCFDVCSLPSPGLTLLRHFPPLKKSYSVSSVGCKKRRARGSRRTL